MPRFIGPKDFRFIQSINNEIINWVIETSVTFYKVIIEESDVDDIYGESINKKYYSGVKINCLINRNDQESTMTNFGPNIKQPLELAINKELIMKHNIIPEIGDVVEWNNTFWEINNVKENQYLGGRKLLSLSYVCQAHLTNLSYNNIIERHQ